MKQLLYFVFLAFLLLFAQCKKDDVEPKSYLSLQVGQSSYEAYESIQYLYERQSITELMAEDSFSSLIAAKHFLSLYHDFVITDSVHPDTIHEYKFHFEADTLNDIFLMPEFSSIGQWPVHQVSSTIVNHGISFDNIYEQLNMVNQIDTFERIISVYIDYKNLEKRFSNNMYTIDEWFATELTTGNEEYTIELQFKKGVLKNIERSKN